MLSLSGGVGRDCSHWHDHVVSPPAAQHLTRLLLSNPFVQPYNGTSTCDGSQPVGDANDTIFAGSGNTLVMSGGGRTFIYGPRRQWEEPFSFGTLERRFTGTEQSLLSSTTRSLVRTRTSSNRACNGLSIRFFSSEATTDGTSRPRFELAGIHASPKRLLAGPAGSLSHPRGSSSTATEVSASSGTSIANLQRVRG